MRVSVKFVDRRYSIVDCENACSALFVPPLIAPPNLLLHHIKIVFHVLLEDKWLTEIQQLGLAAGGLRVAR